MDQLWTIAAWNGLALLAAAIVLWLISLRIRDVSIVDPCWGVGFVLVAWLTFFQQGRVTTAAGIWLLSMVTIWGVRLSLFLARRNWGREEDRRYAAMRAKHGGCFWWVSFFSVFLLQAVLLWVISWPLQAGIAGASEPVRIWLVSGFVLWLTGLLFETIGDWQMARFRSAPGNQGKVMRAGLWSWTRHPNYFGDFCVWWGHFLVAASAGAAWTVFAPLLMSWLLMKVSGVKLLESDIADRRPGYEEYKRETSSFFPWPPANKKAESP